MRIIKEPKAFFESVKKDKGYQKPWLFYMKLMVLYFLLVLVSSILSSGAATTPDIGGFNPIIFAVFGLLFGLILSAGTIFIGAGILHLCLLIVGAKKGFEQTFKISTYATVTLPLLGLLIFLQMIPKVGTMLYVLLAISLSIYMFVIEVFGAKVLHGLSTARAVVGVVVIPLAIVLLFLIIIFGVILLIFFAVAGGSGGVAGAIANTVN